MAYLQRAGWAGWALCIRGKQLWVPSAEVGFCSTRRWRGSVLSRLDLPWWRSWQMSRALSASSGRLKRVPNELGKRDAGRPWEEERNTLPTQRSEERHTLPTQRSHLLSVSVGAAEG